MDWLLVIGARFGIALLQSLPLRIVARLGRIAGSGAWQFDARHRQVALDNLQSCFGAELPPAQLREIARENFRRIGESFACAIKTAAMPDERIAEILDVHGLEHWDSVTNSPARPNRIVAIGHFGNFELFSRVTRLAPGYQAATTYRALRPAGLNRLTQSLRERSGCRFFERRSEADALKVTLQRGGVLLGLLCDQHAGRKGVWGPFLGRECSTTTAPAVFALRYPSELYTAICYRVSLARWRIEIGPRIPTLDDTGRIRSIEAIIGDINSAFETAVRRDLANWFWVHRRWKPRSPATPRRRTGPKADSPAAPASP